MLFGAGNPFDLMPPATKPRAWAQTLKRNREQAVEGGLEPWRVNLGQELPEETEAQPAGESGSFDLEPLTTARRHTRSLQHERDFLRSFLRHSPLNFRRT